MEQILNQLPKNWDDITVEQYIELRLLNVDDFDSDFELILEQLAILLDTSSDDEIFDDLDIDQLLKIMSKIKWLKQEPSLNYKSKINELEIKQLQKLAFGEFIDLNHFFSNNYIENLPIIASILYKNYKIDEWNNKKEEPYKYDIYEKARQFNQVPINQIYGILKSYIDWKEEFLNIYKDQFEDKNWDQIDNEELLDPKEVMDIKKEIEEEKKKSKFSWEAILWELSGNDITKFDKILEMPLILVMNTLAMKKTLGI